MTGNAPIVGFHREIRMAGRRPKYLDIRADLLDRIQRGEFSAGHPLPSQAALSQQYRVTLMTLRQALQCLEDENVLIQQPGRGTFVSPTPRTGPTLDLRDLTSFAAEREEQGIAVTTRLLDARTAKLPRAVRAALEAPPGATGLRLERLRTVHGAAAVHQVSWILEPYAAPLAEADFQDESLYAALAARCGLVLGSATESVRVRSLPAALASTTGVPAGRPVLVTERVTFDVQQRAVLHDLAFILDDSVRVVVRRAPRRTHSTWVAELRDTPGDPQL